MHSYFFSGTPGDEVVLSEAESLHAVKVMREKAGNRALLINGAGWECVGEIMEAHPKKCKFRLIEKYFTAQHSAKLIIAISPTKTNDRIEWFLEKATEIGVDIIIPLECHNQERTKINMERWEKIILSAVKQSRRKWKPFLRSPISVHKLVNEEFDGAKLIAYCQKLPDRNVLDFMNFEGSRMILIGPEGDFSKEEVDEAFGKGFIPVHLGQNRLRTETAGVLAATLLRAHY
jgi:16S rRNA (uracil1498-N3)-methyltransferase